MHQEASQLLNKSHSKIESKTKSMKMTKTKRLFYYLIGYDKKKIETRMNNENGCIFIFIYSHHNDFGKKFLLIINITRMFILLK